MNKILDYLIDSEEFEKFFPLVAISLFVYLFLKFIKDNYPFYKDITNFNYNKKIASFKENLNDIDEKDSLLRKNIQFQIENHIFSNLTGLNLIKSEQNKFLAFYEVVKNELSLNDFKILYRNSKLDDEIIIVNITKTTKVDFYFRLFFTFCLLLVAFLMIILSFYIPNNNIYKTLIITLMYVSIFLIGIYQLSEVIRLKRLFKQIIDKYNNFDLKIINNTKG